MLSRGHGDASIGLRRSKSHSSVRPQDSRYPLRRQQHQQPQQPHRHAVAAASAALARAQQSRKAGAALSRRYASSSDLYSEVNDVKPRESVRFTGPARISHWQPQITRRELARGPESYPSHPESSHKQHHHLRSSHYGDSPITALPSIESPRSTSSSYQKLRKAKSIFTPRKAPSNTFASRTPTSSLLSRTHWRLPSLSNGNAHDLDSRVSMSATGDINDEPLAHELSSDLENLDDEIERSHDEYLAMWHRQRLEKKSSFLNLRSRKKVQKPLRKTVRSSISNDYGIGVSSGPLPSPGKRRFGSKARTISTSFVQRFRKMFAKNSSPSTVFPDQHIDSERIHFGQQALPSDVAPELPDFPVPGPGILSRANSRESNGLQETIHLDPDHKPGSIRSNPSHEANDETNGDGSRVTSWTDSTATSTASRLKKQEAKRLSVIREFGRYKPSQSDSRVEVDPNVLSAFEKLPKDRQGGNDLTDGMYSALQEKLDEDKLMAVKEKLRSLESRAGLRLFPQTSLPSLKYAANNARTDTVRLVAKSSEERLDAARALRQARSARFDSQGMQTDADADADVFTSSITENSKSKAIAHAPLVLNDHLSYQQIADFNEGRHKQPLREMRSAFFPTTNVFKPRELSPYRRALRVSNEEERELDGNHHGSAAHSPSIYSRRTNGTPKPIEMATSPRSSSPSGEPGSAIIQDQVVSPTRARARTRRRAPSQDSVEWQGWMASEVAHLERDDHEDSNEPVDSTPRKAMHRREAAQIDEDDHQVKQYGLSSSTQPTDFHHRDNMEHSAGYRGRKKEQEPIRIQSNEFFERPATGRPRNVFQEAAKFQAENLQQQRHGNFEQHTNVRGREKIHPPRFNDEKLEQPRSLRSRKMYQQSYDSDEDEHFEPAAIVQRRENLPPPMPPRDNFYIPMQYPGKLEHPAYRKSRQPSFQPRATFEHPSSSHHSEAFDHPRSVPSRQPFDPQLRRKVSDQMLERNPLRFPLLERSGSPENRKTDFVVQASSGLMNISGIDTQSLRPQAPYGRLDRGGLRPRSRPPPPPNRPPPPIPTSHPLITSTKELGGNHDVLMKPEAAKARGHVRNRHTPERAERVRRMQSAHSIDQPQQIDSSSQNMVASRIDPATGPTHDEYIPGTRLFRSGQYRLGINSHMYPDTLLERRDGEIVAHDPAPAFL